MRLCKKSIKGFPLLLLLVITFLAVVLGIKSHEMHIQLEFDKLIKEDNLNLTIYYLNPYLLTRYPVSDTDIINGRFVEHKVTIPSSQMKEHIDLFNKINNVNLKPIMFKSYQDTRLLYIFENKKGDKILSISIQAGYGHMYVNGREVKATKLFYEVVMPFLPDDAVKKIQIFIKEQNS